MNTKKHNLYFKFKIKNYYDFSFLHIKVIRYTQKIKTFETSTYRKSALSGFFANFKSFFSHGI